jgi:hypothetical protein
MKSRSSRICNIPETRVLGRSYAGTEKLAIEDAKKAGAGLYWPENPCVNGHLTYRYTKTNLCRACVRDRNNIKAGLQSDPEAVDIRRAIEDRPRKPKDEYDYDL